MQRLLVSLAAFCFGVLLRPHFAERIDSDEFDTFSEQENSLVSTTRPLKVAFAVIAPYGVKDEPDAWTDAFAVLAHSIRKAEEKSVHKISLIAIMPGDVVDPDKHKKELKKLGWEGRIMQVPVSLAEVAKGSDDSGAAFARDALSKVLGTKEELKYYGAAMTEYDRVVILDGDTILLKPIDELFEISPKPGIVGTYDHEMDCCNSSFPPMNSGFAVFTPHKADFDGLVEVYREGDFGGQGFRNSGTGFTYGAGSQGMLSYFYNQWTPGGSESDLKIRLEKVGTDLPIADGGFNGSLQPEGSRFHPVDRSMYDVIQTPSLLEAVGNGLAGADRVKVFHFAGGCTKPWVCDPPDPKICQAMTDAWWRFRDEVRFEKGLPSTARCVPWKEKYTPMDFRK